MKYLFLLIMLSFFACSKDSGNSGDPAGPDSTTPPQRWTLIIGPEPVTCIVGCILCRLDTIPMPSCSTVSAIDTVADSLPDFFLTRFTRGVYQAEPDSLLFYGFLNNHTASPVLVDSCTVSFILCNTVFYSRDVPFDTIPAHSKRFFALVHPSPVPDSLLYSYTKAATPSLALSAHVLRVP